MKSSLFVMLSLFLANALAQTTDLPWSTAPNYPLLPLVSATAGQSRWYQLIVSATGGKSEAKANITIDSTPLPFLTTVKGPSSIIIYAKSLTLKQVANDFGMNGSISVLNTTQAAAARSIWSTRANLTGDRTLVAVFDQPRDAYVGFISPGEGCKNLVMNVVADSLPITDQDKKLVSFLPGSGTVVHGKIIEINVTGECGASLSQGIVQLLSN